jgi:hypothetical protein
MNYFRRRRILTTSGTLRIAITAMMPSARSKVWREIPIFGARSQDWALGSGSHQHRRVTALTAKPTSSGRTGL